MLSSTNETNQPHMTCQLRRQLRFRQEAIRQWLLSLRDNHLGYRYIPIDQDRLNQLPVNGNISEPSRRRQNLETKRHHVGGNPDDGDARGDG